jgi:deazaflavin-dependent oxidoreductase (nitroreductase family)
MSDFNAAVIAEFRAHAGKVGGYFEGANLLLLHTTGAKSGQPRVNPLVYAREGAGEAARLVVAASKGGAPSHPDWYYNLLAHPSATVEVGTEHFPVRATIVAEEPQRSELYALLVAHRSGFAEYEQKTTRQIPIILLERSE